MTNLFFAHSGGVTSIINRIAASTIRAAKSSQKFDRIYVGKNGILGAIYNEMFDVTDFSDSDLNQLANTPASAFGSCRYKLNCPQSQEQDFKRIFKTFNTRNIGAFIYNGGNDSQDTTLKLHQYAQDHHESVQCIGIPKTIDNDLPMIDCCPGYASAAKYLVTSILEASLDVVSMCQSSTKIFIMEVMGRHAGWLAAATSMANIRPEIGPQIILLPEVPYQADQVIDRIKEQVKTYGCCIITVSEGLTHPDGAFMNQQKNVDAFGHAQLGGVALKLAHEIHVKTGFKCHWSVVDYLQRSAGHLTAPQDHSHATALAQHAIKALENQKSGVMVGIHRLCDQPYQWEVRHYPLFSIANQERHLPDAFISHDRLHVTDAFRSYLKPLIDGQHTISYRQGVPDYFMPLNIDHKHRTTL